MNPTYLLDTNICIYIRQRRPARVLARFKALEAGAAALSVITYGELLYGVMKSPERKSSEAKLRELMSLLAVLPLPEKAADTYGEIRAELAAKGTPIGNNDLWIAAHAKASGLILVTNNEREFKRVKGLKVQNWAKA